MRINYQDKYNGERYLDITAYCALKHLEKVQKRIKRTPQNCDWVFRRGDIYLAGINPSFGALRSEICPVIVLQSNSSSLYSPTLIVAPITSRYVERDGLPVHYYSENVRGLIGPAVVLLEQITYIDKRCIRKYIGKMDDRQMSELNSVLEENLGLFVPEDMEAP